MTAPVFHQLYELADDYAWEQLQRVQLKGFPVYFRWKDGRIELWPEPSSKNYNVGLAYR